MKVMPITPLFHFTEDEVNKILSNYDRDLDSVDADVNVIKEWMKQQKHLPIMPNDRQILSFLIMNKFSIERTKEKLDMNYTIRTLIPEFYLNHIPSSDLMREMGKVIHVVPLPKLTPIGNRVIVYKIVDNQNQIFSSTTLIIYIFLLVEIKTLLDMSSSDEYICDIGNISAYMITKHNPMDIKKWSTITEKVYSNRVAKVHIVNVPSFAEVLLNMIKMFVKPKIAKRIHVHKNLDTLTDHYSKEILPKDFGGEEKSIEELNDEYIKLLNKYDDHFKTFQNLKIDESLRPDKLTDDEVLGYHGHFRKLLVD